MNRFAFINHYLDTSLLYERFKSIPIVKKLPFIIQKSIISYLPPYRYVTIGPVHSISGQTAVGVGVLCPLLPEQFVTLNPKKVLMKIIAAAKLGERFGAKIIGLGGFTSVFGDEGIAAARYLKVPLTSGNTYTAALAVQGLLQAADLMGLDLTKSSIAVIGATGDIGSICTRIFSKKCREVILAARNEKRLDNFASEIRSNSLARITVTKYTADAIQNADLVLTATSAITTIVEPQKLKSGTVVCDIAYPANVARDIWKQRADVFVFEGGLAKAPFKDFGAHEFKLRRFNPPGVIHGCLAETILLALEGKFVNFSFGRGNITEEHIEEITQLALNHGFEIAPFHCGDKIYSPSDIAQIRSHVKNKSE